MTEERRQDLAADIEAVIRAVPGVTTVFRTGGVLATVVGAGAQILGIEKDASPLVRVEQSADGTRVEASIGVDDTGSVQIGKDVHAALQDLCTARGVAPARIHITVAHVDDTAREGGAR